MRNHLLNLFIVCLSVTISPPAAAQGKSPDKTTHRSADVEFSAHDGVPLFGRLVLPETKPRAVVIYVQTAEGATIDMKRPLPNGTTFNYFDLYREKLPAMGVGFFSYEGRGIRMGDSPPRFEKIDREVFDTSTLDNKVRDVLSAIEAVRSQEGLAEIPILLMGASEGTLLAAEAASRKPESVDGLVLYGTMADNLRQNFKYILTGGSFLPYRRIDADADGAVSQAEWDAVVKNVPFSQADKNGDGKLTEADFALAGKPLIDAIDNDDFDTLQRWANHSAAVAVPKDWFKDHFDHKEIWAFLKDLDIPVGLFHGERDNLASPPALKKLEAKAKASHRTNLQFHYFEGLDHTLNIGLYFLNGDLPPGHKAIFDFIDRIAPKG